MFRYCGGKSGGKLYEKSFGIEIEWLSVTACGSHSAERKNNKIITIRLFLHAYVR